MWEEIASKLEGEVLSKSQHLEGFQNLRLVDVVVWVPNFWGGVQCLKGRLSLRFASIGFDNSDNYMISIGGESCLC